MTLSGHEAFSVHSLRTKSSGVMGSYMSSTSPWLLSTCCSRRGCGTHAGVCAKRESVVCRQGKSRRGGLLQALSGRATLLVCGCNSIEKPTLYTLKTKNEMPPPPFSLVGIHERYGQ